MSVQKQKLAEMVMQKIKQKKQTQERNRPHYQVLQLQIEFNFEQNEQLKQQINKITQQLQKQQSYLYELRSHLQELENTGKKKYPVITIKPEFIASDHVSTGVKSFYRKSSNTFLKADFIKSQKYQVYLQNQSIVQTKTSQINELQKAINLQKQKITKTLQQKRKKVLKEDVRRRLLIQSQNNVDKEFQKIKKENQILLKEYEIKKQNLSTRISYSNNLSSLISSQKSKIQSRYNPLSYSQYLKQVFEIRVKNQFIQKNLVSAISCINQAKKLSTNYRRQLQPHCSLGILGKIDTKKIQKSKDIRAKTAPKISDIITVDNQESPRKSKENIDSQRTLIRNQYNSLGNLSTRKTLKSLKSDRTLSTHWGSSIKKTLTFF